MENFDFDKTIHKLNLVTDTNNLDLSKFAPGTKYYWWYTEQSKSKRATKKTVIVNESTIGEVRITWGRHRTLLIEIENTFPKYVTRAIEEKYICILTLEDIFFTKEECLENIHKEIKDSEIKEIKEIVQPQRNIWEEQLKEWNETSIKQEESATVQTQNIKEDNFLL